MRKVLPWAFAVSILLVHTSARAMGEKKSVPPREDKVTYAEIVPDRPQLKQMVHENGFNSLSGKEQWELISMVDRYTFFLNEGEYYAGEDPIQSILYLKKAESVRAAIRTRFGHVLKE